MADGSKPNAQTSVPTDATPAQDTTPAVPTNVPTNVPTEVQADPKTDNDAKTDTEAKSDDEESLKQEPKRARNSYNFFVIATGPQMKKDHPKSSSQGNTSAI